MEISICIFWGKKKTQLFIFPKINNKNLTVGLEIENTNFFVTVKLKAI